jgi:hypothetical protein
LYRIYIDEAGDRGVKPSSSSYFVVSAIVVDDAVEMTLRTELAALQQALGRHPGQVIHFRNLTHSQKLKATQDIAASQIATVSNVIVCKRHLCSTAIPGSAPFIANADPMYLWTVRLLLERLSWWVRDHGGGSSVLTFSHIKRFKAQKLHDYRDLLQACPTTIHWPSFDGHRFHFDAPQAIELLQFADVTASATFAAVEPDNYGNTEIRYLNELSPSLYRRSTGPITTYGLNVFPKAQAERGGCLHQLRSV